MRGLHAVGAQLGEPTIDGPRSRGSARDLSNAALCVQHDDRRQGIDTEVTRELAVRHRYRKRDPPTGVHGDRLLRGCVDSHSEEVYGSFARHLCHLGHGRRHRATSATPTGHHFNHRRAAAQIGERYALLLIAGKLEGELSRRLTRLWTRLVARKPLEKHEREQRIRDGASGTLESTKDWVPSARCCLIVHGSYSSQPTRRFTARSSVAPQPIQRVR